MKTAFVTGASRGIGKGIAFELAELGYQLALVATNREKLEEVAQEITHTLQLDKTKEPLIFSLNVVDEKGVEKAVKETYDKTKSIDVLVNGAGILTPGTSELSCSDFLAMLEVNLIGVFHCIHAVVSYMKKQKSGYIFNIASRAGKVGVATQGGYAASKFGLVGLNDSLFNELASFGIKVTAICPGWVDTDLGARSSLEKEDKILVEDVAKTIPFLLDLSPNCCVKEIVLECRKTVELANNPHLKK